MAQKPDFSDSEITVLKELAQKSQLDENINAALKARLSAWAKYASIGGKVFLSGAKFIGSIWIFYHFGFFEFLKAI